MKVQLLLNNEKGVRSGYVNIDPFRSGENVVQGSIRDLGHTVDKGEAEEIVALDVLDHFPAHEVDGVLTDWLSRLRRGGRLTVGVVEVRDVARALLYQTLSLEDVNQLLHGSQEGQWACRLSAMTCDQLAGTLEARGFKIIQKRITNYQAIVTCERP